MSKKQNEKTEDRFENVESALSKSEQFIENNQKMITIIMVALVVIIGSYWGLKKFHIQPRETDAQNAIIFAQQFFKVDSFQLALDGDGDKAGLLDIIDEYGSTPTGNLANYYAGLCYLHLGDFEKAIDYLKDFSGDDEILTYMAYGATGDAYLALEDKDNALTYYKLASDNDNDFTTPIYLMKLGLLQENMGDYSDAVESYTKIKDFYKNTSEGRQIEKYITRAELLSKK